MQCRDVIDALCVFERAVFERPTLFQHPYRYTMQVVRTLERARRLAEVWFQATLAFLSRFRPKAVFVWNGRYLPYSAVTAACEATGQLILTSEIGWIPGTIFLDRGRLSADTTDLSGRSFEAAPAADAARADAFLRDYRVSKATMVSQTVAPAAAVRKRLLAGDGAFLLLYGCQVDWDTNVVIGARRFRSNEEAISFLLQCIAPIPGARLVVKTHPLDATKNEGKLSQIIEGRGTLVADIHPHTLIEAADCVAVRNSTLGFEALCYEKPLIVLEDAKYKHPRLTIDAPNVDDVASSLSRVSTSARDLPDRVTWRQFILHILDHYLLPVRYDYFFEPTKLEILSHFTHNETYRGLERVLAEVAPPTVLAADGRVLRAVDSCELRRPHQEFFLSRQLRKLSDWMS